MLNVYNYLYIYIYVYIYIYIYVYIHIYAAYTEPEVRGVALVLTSAIVYT